MKPGIDDMGGLTFVVDEASLRMVPDSTMAVLGMSVGTATVGTFAAIVTIAVAPAASVPTEAVIVLFDDSRQVPTEAVHGGRNVRVLSRVSLTVTLPAEDPPIFLTSIV